MTRIPFPLRILAAALLAAPGPASAADLARIGVAGAVQGKVQALAPAPGAIGRVIESKKELFHNDQVTTDAKGRLQIMLLDETVFTIGPNSNLVLDEYVYDPATDTGSVSAKISKGVFRFVTGKIARKDPSKMKVKLPVGTIGIRGTIAAGQTDGTSALVVLLGPGAQNNAGERPGMISVESGGESVDITRPGFGTRIEGPGQAPSPPFEVPPSEMAAVLEPLASEPTEGTKEEAAAGGEAAPASEPATEQAGQETAAGSESLEQTESVSQASEELGTTTTLATQDAAKTEGGIADGISTWDQVRTIESGIANYSGSGAFHVTQFQGSPCSSSSCSGSWGFGMDVDFAARQVSFIGASGSAPIGVFFSHSGSFPYGTVSGNAEFDCPGSNDNIHLKFLNSGGKVAEQVEATMTYSDSSNNQGFGEAIVAPRCDTCAR